MNLTRSTEQSGPFSKIGETSATASGSFGDAYAVIGYAKYEEPVGSDAHLYLGVGGVGVTNNVGDCLAQAEQKVFGRRFPYGRVDGPFEVGAHVQAKATCSLVDHIEDLAPESLVTRASPGACDGEDRGTNLADRDVELVDELLNTLFTFFR